MPHTQRIAQVQQPIHHSLRAAANHIGFVDYLFPSRLRRCSLGNRPCRLHLALQASPHGFNAHVARHGGESGIPMQAAIVEIQRGFSIQLLGMGIRIGHAHELQEARPMRIHVGTHLFHHLPVALHGILARLVAEIRQIGVEVIVLHAPTPSIHAGPAAGNPDGRVRLLHRPRPHIHIAKLGEFAIERKRLVSLPRPHHEFHAFAIFIAQGGRSLPVAEDRIHRRADGEARDEPPS